MVKLLIASTIDGAVYDIACNYEAYTYQLVPKTIPLLGGAGVG
jgi:hypothetical protein